MGDCQEMCCEDDGLLSDLSEGELARVFANIGPSDEFFLDLPFDQVLEEDSVRDWAGAV